jgi:inosine/xanthosine triphosphate pyrophosphatase family protein
MPHWESGLPALADDAGLCVTHQGLPGDTRSSIQSAMKSDANNQGAAEQLRDEPNRRAAPSARWWPCAHPWIPSR